MQVTACGQHQRICSCSCRWASHPVEQHGTARSWTRIVRRQSTPSSPIATRRRKRRNARSDHRWAGSLSRPLRQVPTRSVGFDDVENKAQRPDRNRVSWAQSVVQIVTLQYRIARHQ